MKKYKLFILVCAVAVTLCSCSSESSNIYTQYDDEVSNVISTVRSLDNPYFEDYIFTQLESPYYSNEKIYYPVIFNGNTSTSNSQNTQNIQNTQNSNTSNVNPYYNSTYQNQNYSNYNGYNSNNYNSNAYPNMNNVMYGGLYNPNYMNSYGNGNGYANNTNNYGNYNNGGYVGYNNWGNGYNNGFVNNTSLLGGTFLGNAVIPNIDTYSYKGQNTATTVTASSSDVTALDNLSEINQTTTQDDIQNNTQNQNPSFNYANQYRNYSPKYINTNNYANDYQLNNFITNIQDLYYITNDLTAANSIVSNQVNSVVSTTMKIRKYLYILDSANHSISDTSKEALRSNFDALSTILTTLKSSIGSVSSELIGIATLKQNFTANAGQLNSKYLKIINVLDCRIIQLNNLQTALSNIKNTLTNEYSGNSTNGYEYLSNKQQSTDILNNVNLVENSVDNETNNLNTQSDSVDNIEQNPQRENSVSDDSILNTEEKLNSIKEKIDTKIEQESADSNESQLDTETETNIIDNADIIDETMSDIKTEQNVLQDDCSETKNIIDEIADNIDSNIN